MEMVKQHITPPKFEHALQLNLPSDYSPHIPSVAMEWYRKFNITVTENSLNRIGWSDKRESMIFPVYARGDLLLYQARYFGDDPKKPKWLTYGIKNFLFTINTSINGGSLPTDTIILVEDIISTIKVGRVGTCGCLFGSSISGELIHRIQKNYKKCILWLDADKKASAIKTALQLGEVGLQTKCVFTDLDPKYYITPDIRVLVSPKKED